MILRQASSFDSLIGKADYQCERTLSYINNAEEITFYDDKKNEKVTFNRGKYKKSLFLGSDPYPNID